MAASSGPAHAASEAGKSFRWMNRPFEVPARIKTAGRLRRTLRGFFSHAIGHWGMRMSGICETANAFIMESFAVWTMDGVTSDRSIYGGLI
jgi:hypothetical protein